MDIIVQHDIKQMLPKLEQFSSRQAPFAIAKALTSTAKLVQAEVTNQIPVAFDRPNAWTRRAFTIQAARKQDLTAYVFAKRNQARYLKFGVQGGGRRVKGFERRVDAETNADEQANAGKLVPTRNVKLDAQGNVSLATIKRITAQAQSKKGKYFIGKPKGGKTNSARGYGIYERVGPKIRMLMAFSEPKPYKTRLDLPGIGRKVVAANIAAQLEQAWSLAMRTARR